MRIIRFILLTFISLQVSFTVVIAQCPDQSESNLTVVITDETCDGEEDGSISINFVTAAGIYEPILGDLDPTGDYLYSLWDASLADFVYDDIGINPIAPVNPNIYIDYTTPNNIVFRNLPPNSGFFGYVIVAERQNGDGCAASYTSDILGMRVGPGEPLPTAALSGGGIVCAGDPLPNVVFNFTGLAPYDFTYEVSGIPVNVTNHNSDIYTITGATPGVYQVTQVTDGNGCNAIDLGTPVSVIANPIPNPTISGPNSLCADAIGLYTTESGSGESNYIWNVSGGTILSGGTLTDPNVQVQWDGGAPHVVSVNYNNILGCNALSPTNYAVSVNPLPIPTITGQSNTCVGSNYIYSTESGSGENNYAWIVTGGSIVNGGGNGDATIEILWDGVAPYSVSVNYIDGNGCTALLPTNLSITVNPLPNPTITGISNVCSGSTEIYTTESGGGQNNYQWLITGGSIVSGGTIADSSIEVLWDGTAPYEVSINYSDLNGCVAPTPTILPITVNPLPAPTIIGPLSLCFSSIGIYNTESGSGENNYSWVVSGGTIINGGSTTDASIEIQWDGSAPYQLSVNYEDVNGCTAVNPTILPVTVNPLPVPTISGILIVCEGSTENYITESGSGESNYNWIVAGGTIIGGGTPTDASVQVQWDGTAPYTLSVNYDNVNGCTAITPTVETITVNPNPVPVLTGPTIVCTSDSATYSTDSGSGQSNFVWNVSGGTVINGGALSDPNIEIRWDGAAPNTISINYTDLNGCTAVIPTNTAITVNPLPVPTITGPGIVCAESTETYSTESGSGESNFNWNVTGGTIVSGGSLTDPSVIVQWDGVAPFQVSVNYDNVSGCSALASTVLPVIVNALPVPGIVGPAIACVGSTETYITDSGAGQTNYVWAVLGGTMVSGGTAIDNFVEIQWDGVSPHEVGVNYTDVNGCTANIPTVQIVTLDPLPIPVITGPTTVCAGSTETYTTDSGSGESGYIWAVSGGIIINGGGITNDFVEVTWDGAAPHDVGVNYTDVNGCSALIPTILNITTTPRPSSVSFLGNSSICEGDNTDLIISINGGTQPYQVYLSTDGGVSISDTIDIPDTNPFTYNTGSLLSTTVYSIMDVIDNNSCTIDPANLPADVTVTVTPAENVTMALPDNSSLPGDELLMPVTLQGFNNIVTTNFTLKWDSTIIRFVSIENISGISELDISDFNLVDSATLTLEWIESSGTGQSIPDGQSLFSVRFELIGTSCYSSPVLFDGSPVAISVIDANTCTTNLTTINGSIDITGSTISAPPIMGYADSVNCINDPVPDLLASGINIQWYSDKLLTNLVSTGNIYAPILDNSNVLDTIFYATQTIGACDESPADSSRIQYIAIPAPPVPDQVRYEICLNDPAPTLTATGINISWYSDPGLANLVGTGNSYTPGPADLDTSVPDTTFFYITQSNQCGESIYDSTGVFVKAQSYRPIVNTPVIACMDNSIPTLMASGINIQWYSDAGLTILVGTGNTYTPDPALLDMSVPGITPFYATQDDGCGESLGATLLVNVIDCTIECTDINEVVTKIDPDCNSTNGEIQIVATGGTGYFTFQLIDSDSLVATNKSGLYQGLRAGTYIYDIIDDTAGCITPRQSITLENLSNITAYADTSSFVNSVCFGEPLGRAIIVASGGGLTYEYSIDGNTWNTFISGEYINGLPPNGTYLILVRESASDLCFEQVYVTINNEYPPILFTYSSTDATCDDDDGTITIESMTGGLSPYEISFEFGNFTPVDLSDLPVYANLSHGLKDIKVRDINNCVVEDQALVNFPGYVTADILTSPPTCFGQGKDGKVSITIDSTININPPPYSFGIAYDTTPVEDVVMNPIPSNTTVIFDTLTNGGYYVLLESATGCIDSTEFLIGGGPFEVSFDLTNINDASCKGGSGSVTIDNVTGDIAENYLVELLSLPGQNPVYSVSLTSAEISDGYTIDGSVTDQFTAGDYEVRLSQEQSGCRIVTDSQPFTISEPQFELDFTIVQTTPSWPETASGTITLHVTTSGGDPYETSLETRMSNFPGQDIFLDWEYVEEIPGNPTVYEYTYQEIYSGVYDIYVRDYFGCVILKEAIVPYDQEIYIPNVFTPNGDSYNEDFFIRNLPPQGSGTLLIVTNRWGKIVFQTDDYNYDNLWNGDDSPDATYYYKLDIPDKGTFTGWVEIWRGSER